MMLQYVNSVARKSFRTAKTRWHYDYIVGLVPVQAVEFRPLLNLPYKL